MRWEIERIVTALRVKCPSILTDLKLTCTACRTFGGSAKWHISSIPLQCEGTHERKTVSTLKVKCPSLLADFNRTGTVGSG
jgi:hypothetical protein